ncbi:site-specific integrase [Enterocloster clostridioformis]|uniref:site-specific integrase n=1 Tax=Enterocloster clostridioformis TaxID=1531 RepID=UPI00080C599C|nr:site-specific integrase [Enterocloster clostridioformis]ANU49414.1 site-specific integrase [Lachnoclostridium sp. YL32]NDO31754.1 site-specific integrase [Enterocloster clostridioformis]OXE64250.1 site-specific integrase [Enterocloster clostridioformis]QQR01665.1 site-specific integrase [Enterocloster clostridioformis]
MSEVRRDNKGRKLFNGESQRKDGKYEYKYQDAWGKRKTVYSWKLTPTDRVPAGKRDDISLREKIKQIQKDLNSNITPDGGNSTVLELVEKYISQKTGVRHNTRSNYNFVVNVIKKEAFGQKRIDKIKVSDAKEWLIKMQQIDGRGYSSIHTIRGVVRPAFQMAVDDDLLVKNPFEFQLNTVVVNDSVTREAITRQQERDFLEFVKNDKHFCKYYDGIYILFKTGLRISEFVGLTKKNLDFENNRIIVDHQLQRTRDMKYIIEGTKTESGERMVPMTPEVKEAFQRILANRKNPKVEPMVDGYSGFLYLDKNGRPMVALHWEKYFQHIREKYNKIYRIQMPKVTPHVCRHTFCSNMNPKTLQYIMGHSDISVSLNTCTHLNYDDAEEEMQKVVEASSKKSTTHRKRCVS